jgi:alginate O-acetyltransferase complex protein AlgF
LDLAALNTAIEKIVNPACSGKAPRCGADYALLRNGLLWPYCVHSGRRKAVRTVAVLALVVAVLAPASAAAQQSVYGPEVAGNTAFVRFVNALPGASPQSFELGATTFDALAYAAVSPYRPVTPDIYQLDISDNQLEIIPEAGTYYTILCTPKGISALKDPTHVDAARAQLFLYNVGSFASLDLKTADGKTGVIMGVKPNASGVKVVNAVSASLAVWNGAKRVAALGALALSRGSSFSVFVIGDGAGAKVFAVKASVAAQ